MKADIENIGNHQCSISRDGDSKEQYSQDWVARNFILCWKAKPPKQSIYQLLPGEKNYIA